MARASDLRFIGRMLESCASAPLRSGLRQATYTCVPLTPSGMTCVRAWLLLLFAGPFAGVSAGW